jgi:uncharacterized protein (UPF0548 family)
MGPFGTGGISKSVCFGRPSSGVQENPKATANAIHTRARIVLGLGKKAFEKRENDIEVIQAVMIFQI